MVPVSLLKYNFIYLFKDWSQSNFSAMHTLKDNAAYTFGENCKIILIPIFSLSNPINQTNFGLFNIRIYYSLRRVYSHHETVPLSSNHSVGVSSETSECHGKLRICHVTKLTNKCPTNTLRPQKDLLETDWKRSTTSEDGQTGISKNSYFRTKSLEKCFKLSKILLYMRVWMGYNDL